MSKQKLSLKNMVGIFAALAIIGSGYLLFKHQANAKNTGDVMGKPQAMPVSTQIVSAEPTQVWSSYSARLEAVEFAEIRPQVSGTITELKFEDGQTVEKGDLLFVIDTRPYQAALNQAKADLAAAKNQSSLTWKELKRAKELIKTNAISKRIADERSTAHTVAASNVKAAQARLDAAQINLDYANIVAPISGRLSRAEIKEGNLVQAGAGAPVLTSIISTENIYADFEVDEQSYIKFIKDTGATGVQDQKIPVKLIVGEGNIEREGHIDSFDNRIDVTSGTIRARAIFENTDGALLPGMFATVKMGSPTKQEQITLSEKAIGTDQDRKFVYVVNDDNVTEYRQVQIGNSSNGQRVILSGLEDGERVITAGLIRIRPGVKVAPKDESADDAQEISKEQDPQE